MTGKQSPAGPAATSAGLVECRPRFLESMCAERLPVLAMHRQLSDCAEEPA